MAKNTTSLTLGDKAILRSIVETIAQDDKLRKGFRGCNIVTTTELKRLEKRLTEDINEAVEAATPLRVALP